MDVKDTYIPQHLDLPTRYVFFTIDELMAIVVPTFIGIMMNSFLGGLIGGGIAWMALRRVKQGTSLSRIYDRAYWLLPSSLFNFKDMPGSDLREMAG
ncbi:type IV conjugative transfer system protein TraL [Brevundimonas naejangsanensis]|uniref:type IV conjugative transfer system protein TraL n=1 Tax=Brevundimonas naejangsanensis TaxID=588932 RepID=UPI003D07A16F